jgi:hypothetical protein
MALKSIKGSRGEVTIPALGAVVARIDRAKGGWWEISAREDDRKSGEPVSYRLRVLFTYLNPAFMQDAEYNKEFVVWLGDKRFRIEWPGHERMAPTGRTLSIEKGVTFVELDSN